MTPLKFLTLSSLLLIFGGCEPAVPTVKTWPPISNEHLGPGVRELLKSRWHDGKLSYIVTINPASELLKKERDKYGIGASFSVQFSDDAGFVVLRDSFFLKQMTAIIDDSGKPTQFEYQDELTCDRTLYRSLKTWALTWSIKD